MVPYLIYFTQPRLDGFTFSIYGGAEGAWDDSGWTI